MLFRVLEAVGAPQLCFEKPVSAKRPKKKKQFRVFIAGYCKVCGAGWVTNCKLLGAKKFYCSKACRAVAQLKPIERTCAGCGKKYIRTNTRHETKYCDDGCYRRHWTLPLCECKGCGNKFAPKNGKQYTSYCSRECFQATRCNGSKVSRPVQYIYSGHHVRRAKKFGVSAEKFKILDVFVRDNWTCMICKCATPQELRGSLNDSAPELDHIVAMAQGGEHKMDNCQCICRACNIFKGTMSNEQFIMWNQWDRRGG